MRGIVRWMKEAAFDDCLLCHMVVLLPRALRITVQTLQLNYTIRFRRLVRTNPPPSASSPSKPIRERSLAVLGKDATSTGAAATAGSSGGASTTWAVATVSPVGLTASTGTVFRVSTGAEARATGVESTGSFVSLANSMALDLS
jgi:hypothetical protein